MSYDERGHSLVNGEYIVNVPTDASRERRIAIRMASGDVLQECVQSGYVIGRDDDTKAQSDRHLLAFLDRVLGG